MFQKGPVDLFSQYSCSQLHLHPQFQIYLVSPFPSLSASVCGEKQLVAPTAQHRILSAGWYPPCYITASRVLTLCHSCRLYFPCPYRIIGDPFIVILVVIEQVAMYVHNLQF